MQITSSYGVEIKKQNIPIRHTLRIYRSAVSYLVQVYAESWEGVIVFEYLEMSGRISENKKQKLHLWRKRDIQKLCEHQVHRKGIRISRVSARNTSRLAYDGSGVETGRIRPGKCALPRNSKLQAYPPIFRLAA